MLGFQHAAWPFEQLGLIAVLLTGVTALLYAWFLARRVLREDPGTERMQEISNAIRQGSVAYLNKQMQVVIPISLILAVVLFAIARIPGGLTAEGGLSPEKRQVFDMAPAFASELDQQQLSAGLQEHFQQKAYTLTLQAQVQVDTAGNQWTIVDGDTRYLLQIQEALLIVYEETPYMLWSIAIGRGAALLLGAACSLAIGQLGLRVIGTRGNVRVANQARLGSFQGALRVAYHSGTVAGMLADGLGLLGGTIIFVLYGEYAPQVLLGFGFGGTLLAMFMRVGGGIYTKAADVGADLVGKVEAGVPEDDPRNAAVIADLVGDNVGDFSGMAEDVFESYEVTIVSAMILGLAVMQIDPNLGFKAILFPLLVRAIGVFSSIVGTYAVSLWPTKGDAFRAMDLSYDLSSIISTSSFFLLAWFYVDDLRLFAATAAGILLAVGFNKYTAAFTQRGTAAVNRVVRSTRTGSATVILSGLALGYESTVWASMIIVLIILLSIAIYSVTIPAGLVTLIIAGAAVLAVAAGLLLWRKTDRLENGIFGALGVMVVGLIVSSFQQAPEGQRVTYVLYSVALAGIGMLSHTGNNLAMDAFGPLADNAGGIAEMAKEDFDAAGQATLAELDSVGNTTKAITKGIAIASAVVAAVSLFGAFIETTGLGEIGLNIADPIVFIGLLIGGALPFLFSSVLLRAVERAAALIIAEVRKQFHIPGVLEGTVKPEYGKVVRICTDAAQRELIVVAMLGIMTPVVVGFLIGERALGGFLAGIIVVGQLLAVFMANAGGAWDNAKKEIECEVCDQVLGTGKGSERHKAGVIGDTVGDPLKDTAGPALNPMIKVVNLVSLLLAPLLMTVSTQGGAARTLAYVIGGVFLVALLVGILISKREPKDILDGALQACQPAETIAVKREQ